MPPDLTLPEPVLAVLAILLLIGDPTRDDETEETRGN
jgi:hypothetical protein